MHWAVTVERDGDAVVTIESNCLSGRDLLPGDEEAIRAAAMSLLGFIGRTAAWQSILTAPKDGTAVLGYGRHTGSPQSAAQGVKAGDHWWAIMLWDVYRDPPWGWVFAKDGTPTWSEPTHWMQLPTPPFARNQQGSGLRGDPAVPGTVTGEARETE